MPKPHLTANPDPADGQPWWRVGMMWLVLGGPAVVVVAAIATGVIAHVGADELVKDPALSASVAAPTSQTPAVQARNNAATASGR